MMIEKTYPIAHRLITNALNLTRKLHHLLTEEAVVLKSNKAAESVTAIAQKKQQIVSHLNEFSQHLAQLLASEKLPNTSESLISYLAIAEKAGINTHETTLLWAEIKSLSEASRTLNESNGASITILSNHTQRSLHILKGKPETNYTYGPDGATKSNLYSRTLVSA